MKEADADKPLPLGLDHPWPSCLSPAPRLRLSALDFSDLWDEEDLGLEDLPQTAPAPPPAPLLAPPPPCPAPPPAPLPAPPPPRLALPTSRTLRLHWRALHCLPLLPAVGHFGPQTIWAGLQPVDLDTRNLELLFESKAPSALSAKGSRRRQRCVSVLGVKRSNIITIALSSLPPPHLLPPAILSMDCCVLDREDLQKLQALVPSEEELRLIQEAQAQSPGLPLAPAELCLTTLGAIPHLRPRLQLWAFALDYDTLEKEIAEPLFHLKQAMEQLAASQTFHHILATVLAIGNFLNGCKVRGFELSFLGQLSEVRDTQSRQPLLQHVCALLLQLYPQSSDLFSELPAVTRASKWEYSHVGSNLAQLQSCCKASWEQLHLLQQVEDGRGQGRGQPEGLRESLPHFLRESEERLGVLQAVHRRVINRFHSFLLYLGYTPESVRGMRAESFCKGISDFALEYKTTRHAMLQQRQREQRGPPNTAAPKHTPTQETLEHGMLEEILRTPESTVDPILSRHRNKHTGDLSRRLKW